MTLHSKYFSRNASLPASSCMCIYLTDSVHRRLLTTSLLIPPPNTSAPPLLKYWRSAFPNLRLKNSYFAIFLTSLCCKICKFRLRGNLGIKSINDWCMNVNNYVNHTLSWKLIHFYPKEAIFALNEVYLLDTNLELTKQK